MSRNNFHIQILSIFSFQNCGLPRIISVLISRCAQSKYFIPMMHIAIQQQRLLEVAMQLCLKSILLSSKSDKKIHLGWFCMKTQNRQRCCLEPGHRWVIVFSESLVLWQQIETNISIWGTDLVCLGEVEILIVVVGYAQIFIQVHFIMLNLCNNFF